MLATQLYYTALFTISYHNTHTHTHTVHIHTGKANMVSTNGSGRLYSR